MKRKHKHMVETRRLYKFESLFEVSAFANRPRSIQYLRALCERVWAKHGRRRVRAPIIDLAPDAQYSFCRGYREIKLAPHHRTVDVLLHEITHALGYCTHGRAFVRRYVKLLVEYGKCDEGKLVLGLGMFGIKT